MTRRHTRDTGTSWAITLRSIVVTACLFTPSIAALGVPPDNDDCINATVAVDGDTPFTTIEATTDGNLVPPICVSGNVFTQIDNDVWFQYLAECTGDLTVSVCGAPFDTKIAVYDVCEICPANSVPIGCDDDFCNLFGASETTVSVLDRECYLIRIGGFSLATGAGTLSLTCVVPPPPTGSCCDNGTCLGTLTEDVCTTSGGTSWHNGEVCPPFSSR